MLMSLTPYGKISSLSGATRYYKSNKVVFVGCRNGGGRSAVVNFTYSSSTCT